MTVYPDKYCVYHHKMGRTVFYVGSGVSSRPFDSASRTEAWHSYVKEHGGSYRVKVAAWFNTQGQARRFEDKEIERLKPLTNFGWLSPYWRSKTTRLPVSITQADRRFIRLLIKGV